MSQPDENSKNSNLNREAVEVLVEQILRAVDERTKEDAQIAKVMEMIALWFVYNVLGRWDARELGLSDLYDKANNYHVRRHWRKWWYWW